MVVSLIAMLLAVPVAIGIALFITQYAPKQLARPVAYIVDLLAAIPSIVYGIWGIGVLAPKLAGVQTCAVPPQRIPLFANRNVPTGSIFDGSIVLAMMILPIITAIRRDVFERTPRTNIEAAWALGATRWEMIRLAVLPYGRPGVISGSMLGLGRALGETIAISLILSAPATGSPSRVSIFTGGETFASKIANNAAEFNDPKSDRRLHRRRPGAVRADLRRQRRGPLDRQPPQGVLMTTLTAPPASTPSALAAQPGHGWRKAKDRIATVAGHRRFVVALVPLIWLLWTVISRAAGRSCPRRWWTGDQRNHHLPGRWRRRLPRDRRHRSSRSRSARSSRCRSP